MEGAGDLERWAADARAREAADTRVRERWLRAQAEEDTSLSGVLLSLAERRETVVLATVTGRRHRGAVTGVGEDFVAVQDPGGPITLVSLGAVGDVRMVATGDTGARAFMTGDPVGPGALGVRLVDVLAQAAGQRPRILVHAGAASVVGDLVAVGRDVLTVRTDGTAGPVYVGLASLSEVSFLASG